MTATHSMPNLGTQQSPIALNATLEAKDLGVVINWDALVLERYADGYSPSRKLTARPAKKSGHLLLDGQKYVPVDCHWHFPCEHTLGKTGFPAEVHVVHVHKDDVQYALQGKLDWCRIAVLGVFVKQGTSAYGPMTVAADEGSQEHKLPMNKILPRKGTAIRYDGGLTTPPYSENVTFVIFDTPVSATKQQLDAKGKKNARALQACNRRYCVLGRVKK